MLINDVDEKQKHLPISFPLFFSLSVWRGTVAVALVSSEVSAAGQTVLDLKATSASLGRTGDSVCPLDRVPRAPSQAVIISQILIPNLDAQTKVRVHLHE